MPSPRSLVHRSLDYLLTRDRRRRFQLVQTGLAIFAMFVGLVGLLFLRQHGLADTTDIARWTAFAVPGWFVFFLMIRSGATQRRVDPSMTVWQMSYGVACCAGAYAISGPARGSVFPLLMTVMMFNVFSLSPRQLTAITTAALALFATTMAWRSATRPDLYPPAVEQLHFWMLATMMPVVVMLASQLSKVRSRLHERTQALEASLERNQFLATRDDLTGLINRRQLLEIIERDHLRAARGSDGYCLALIDLDHFKRINDRYGHAAGDAVLQAFAREASRHMRGTDALGRWGGEEFLVHLPDADPAAAREGLERLRRVWADHRITVAEDQLRLTFSAGLVQLRPGETVARTIERADAALYRAKGAGRDRVVCEA